MFFGEFSSDDSNWVISFHVKHSNVNFKEIEFFFVKICEAIWTLSDKGWKLVNVKFFENDQFWLN